MPTSVGFLGMGIMGSAMAANLNKSELFGPIAVWNRTSSKCDELKSQGAKVVATPAEVVRQCDITFGCLSDPTAAADVVLSEGGVLEGISANKGYVDMSTVDEQTSIKIGKAIAEKGGRFVEAPVSGSKKPAIDGTLIILAAGDPTLYKEALPCFDIMGKKSFLLSDDVGAGARMKLVVNMIMGSMLGSLCEGMALADKGGLSQNDVLEVLSLGALNNPAFNIKGPTIIKREYPTNFPLKHQEKDVRLAIALGNQLGQSLPIAEATNELYKQAMEKGHGDDDFAAVYEAVAPPKKTE
ncbi:hypothetical protein BSKO_07245 [Bryopsis sp. KO-2023]|nr:hypothetical protein BSKO_07245 [Bryopsis sp. KO-2023]